MNSSTLPYGLAVVLIVAAMVAIVLVRGSRDEPIGAASETLEEFTLAKSTGGELSSADLKGEVWVASFFFTACPGPCLNMNKAIDTLHDAPEFEDVKFVSITCDPPTDTLEVLQKYADQFEVDPDRWYFCRGELGYVQKVGEDIMKLTTGYQQHTSYAVLIDREGKVRGRYSVTDPVQLADLKQNIELALADLPPSKINPASLGTVEEDAPAHSVDTKEEQGEAATAGAG